jgi:ketosteroid isomerase-like protein
MSKFQGWPEQQRYEGVLGAQRFLDDWTDAWENWELEIEEIYEAGDKVVVIVHQWGKARTTGMALDMVFVQTWTFREGLFTRMDMFSDPSEALLVAGVERSTSANLADPNLDKGGDNPR